MDVWMMNVILKYVLDITMTFQASVNCIMMEICDSCEPLMWFVSVHRIKRDKTINTHFNSIHCYGIYCLDTVSDPQYTNSKMEVRNTGQEGYSVQIPRKFVGL
jgi:hypothetical protein